MTVEVDTTQRLIDYEGAIIKATQPVLMADGQVIDVPMMTTDGTEQRIYTFRLACFIALNRLDVATLDEGERYDAYALTAKVMALDTVKLEKGEVTLLKKACGTGRALPILVSGRVRDLIDPPAVPLPMPELIPDPEPEADAADADADA